MLDLNDNFQFTHGSSIHTCGCHQDQGPHLTGTYFGNTEHIPYYGQTTLGMFDTKLSGHTFNEVSNLHSNFPDTFKDSGLKW